MRSSRQAGADAGACDFGTVEVLRSRCLRQSRRSGATVIWVFRVHRPHGRRRAVHESTCNRSAPSVSVPTPASSRSAKSQLDEFVRVAGVRTCGVRSGGGRASGVRWAPFHRRSRCLACTRGRQRRHHHHVQTALRGETPRCSPTRGSAQGGHARGQTPVDACYLALALLADPPLRTRDDAGKSLGKSTRKDSAGATMPVDDCLCCRRATTMPPPTYVGPLDDALSLILMSPFPVSSSFIGMRRCC